MKYYPQPPSTQYRKVSLIERETVMYRLLGLAVVVVVLMVFNVLDLKSGNQSLNSSSAILKCVPLAAKSTSLTESQFL